MEIVDIIPFIPAGISSVPAGLVKVNYRSAEDRTADWTLACPPTSGTTWVVYLHGHGSGGDQLYTRQDVRTLWLPKFLDCGLGVLTPNLRGNAWMGPAAAADLHALLQWVRTYYGAERFLLCGGSMGGTSVLIYAILHPQDVAAAAACCPVTDLGEYFGWCRGQSAPVLGEIVAAIEHAYGGGPDVTPGVYQRHSVIAHSDRLAMPVFLVHGQADPIIPVDHSHRLTERMRGRTGFRYREMPDGDHDIPLQCEEAVAWICSQHDLPCFSPQRRRGKKRKETADEHR